MSKWRKKKIDERQQADLNRIGNYGYWIAFWLLIGSIMLQNVILHRPVREWIAEWVVFMVLAVYGLIACIKIGVWTPYTRRPTLKHCVLYSLAGSGSFSVLFTIGNCRYMTEGLTISHVISIYLIWFAGLFLFMMAGFLVSVRVYNRKQEKIEEKLNEELDDEDE